MRPTTPTADAPLLASDVDIADAMAGWSADGADGGPARLIDGADGRAKLQVRVELGVLQMETDGRPDGIATEHTVLAGLRRKLGDYRRTGGSDATFPLPEADVIDLDREGRLYAKRYLAWFGLGQWNRVVRDARHHLAAIDFATRYAPAQSPAKAALRRWLPYAAMMLARAEAALLAGEGDPRSALKIVNSAERRLKRHYRRLGGAGARMYRDSEELAVLRQVARRLKKRVPVSDRRLLRRELAQAVTREDYERAAVLRDRLANRDRDRGDTADAAHVQ